MPLLIAIRDLILDLVHPPVRDRYPEDFDTWPYHRRMAEYDRRIAYHRRMARLWLRTAYTFTGIGLGLLGLSLILSWLP